MRPESEEKHHSEKGGTFPTRIFCQKHFLDSHALQAIHYDLYRL